MRPTRETFLAACRALEGVPYVWGGRTARGLDCSGLVVYALRAIGGADLRGWWSDKLWQKLPPVDEPQAGDLAFYGEPDDPEHVVVCLGGPYDAIIGANGGGSATKTPEAADRKKPPACVRREKHPKYRADFIGYRNLQPLLTRSSK